LNPRNQLLNFNVIIKAMSYNSNFERGKDGRSKVRNVNDGVGGLTSDLGYIAGQQAREREQRQRQQESDTRRDWEETAFRSNLEHERYMAGAGYIKKWGKWYDPVTGELVFKKPVVAPLPEPLNTIINIFLGILLIGILIALGLFIAAN
jgi:hypothetical protein